MKKSSPILGAILGLFFALMVPSTASAQDDTSTPPPAPTPTPGPRVHRGAGFGLGASAFLSGPAGIQIAYDMRAWHAEAMFGFSSNNGTGAGDAAVTNFQFGVRAWYHLHNGINSDLSVGGGAGFITRSGGGSSPTATLIEPGMLARVFLTPNFALHAMAGLSMVVGDSVAVVNGTPYITSTGFRLGAQFLGGFGFTYFFV